MTDNMMKKSVLVTHTDLDGVATSVIFLKRCIDYGISNKVYYCDIDEVDDTLNHLIKNDLENEEIENLYIVDVTPKNIDIINALSRYQKKC
jgi:single-stranded DNA-specific DHH superfamily exonuclease